MRPVNKGSSPVSGDFSDYEAAKPDLISRLGKYCSYCERRVQSMLAVEHIEPKDSDYGKPELIGRWSNFLLACVNCNSCKGKKEVDFEQLIFPDRDNTFHAYVYEEDGNIALAQHLTPAQKVMAGNTLRLVGLDKAMQVYTDSNGEQVALDRVAQRMESFATAQSALSDMNDAPNCINLKNSITRNALSDGFFSVWMTVFNDYPDMKLRFIRAFTGTEGSGCFDMNTGDNITPAPNHNCLDCGGKV
ncbi:HNH endonuclease [Morganella morganii]|uniref:HNH endonuclease n=1 Tax=Morganella morganii TaxID=582 RepID=UPI001299FAAD|nr:HNH endonuclease [Morganella morganii]MCU6355921.1 HNH endonuclease [Morganella morganii]MRE58242.1 HNH endonuclease [Morganella morganii]HDU8645487.1 HNH endonuclease [Morganella morganii subsp. morganii]